VVRRETLLMPGNKNDFGCRRVKKPMTDAGGLKNDGWRRTINKPVR